MDKYKEILNYLLSGKNAQSIAILVLSILMACYVFNNFLLPKINSTKSLMTDISSDKERYENLVVRKKAKDLEQKKNVKKINKVPVVIYKPQKQGIPIESSSIELVTKIIEMLEKTDNKIMDISYKVDPLNVTDKLSMPSSISVVELIMTLNSTYESFQNFVNSLYGEENLSTIKQIKVTPLKENKKTLEINTVIWLYISK